MIIWYMLDAGSKLLLRKTVYLVTDCVVWLKSLFKANRYRKARKDVEPRIHVPHSEYCHVLFVNS